MKDEFQKLRMRIGLGAAAALLVLALAGTLFWPDSFWRGYWFALMFWTQLSIGSLIVLLLQQLTGGAWGRAAAPLLRATASGLFVLLPFFAVAFFALPHIFPWTQIRIGISSQVLVNKLAWLNAPFFVARSCLYLGGLGLFAWLWRSGEPRLPAGPALALTIVLISFASTDWMMSLQPTFYSSLYPFQYFSGCMVVTLALVAGSAAWLESRGWAPQRPDLLLAYGKLLFAAVLFWGYIVFSQFIIIWTGNLPDEAQWYVIRSRPDWNPLTMFILVCYFAIPFCLLLSQEVKKNSRQLFAIAAALMAIHLLQIFWLMRPSPERGLHLSLFDFLLPPLMGAIWLWFVTGRPQALLWLQTRREEGHE